MPVPDHPASNRRFPTGDPDLSDLGRRDPLDTMPHGSFQSSNVHSALYDFGERQLFVRYLRDGPDAIYQYWEVPASTWDALKLAASKGSYINANIAYEYQYALFGRDDFPERGRGLGNDLARRFVTDP
jgi:hypothetical protein